MDRFAAASSWCVCAWDMRFRCKAQKIGSWPHGFPSFQQVNGRSFRCSVRDWPFSFFSSARRHFKSCVLSKATCCPCFLLFTWESPQEVWLYAPRDPPSIATHMEATHFYPDNRSLVFKARPRLISFFFGLKRRLKSPATEFIFLASVGHFRLLVLLHCRLLW